VSYYAYILCKLYLFILSENQEKCKKDWRKESNRNMCTGGGKDEHMKLEWVYEYGLLREA
jgi:hypothetical protein